MSVPSIRGKVERYKNIELTYYNENGEKIVKKLNGFFARLVQHECDHLDGIVFLEKVKEPNGFATVENINKYNLREEENNSMELICKITDEDIGEKSINMENPQLRLGAKSYNKLIASKYESIYSTKFVVLRDRKILERYMEINKQG